MNDKKKKKRPFYPRPEGRVSKDLREFRKKYTLEIIRDKPQTSTELRKQRVGSTQFKNKILKELKEEGLVKMVKEGKKFPYKITKKGKKALDEYF